ncbi:MAG: ribosome maturation factor RimP [Coriobacteriia bacterium]|nr:ribosome maturation factor RimP [Coriobacteriia bacterium]
MALTHELIALLEPLVVQNGLELVTVEVAGGQRHRVVRVFLDREGGIDIEAVAGANSWLSEVLDEFPRLSGPYTLEVSSPGIERVLRTREHFERFSGSHVVVNTVKPIDGRARFTGYLVGLCENDVVLEIDKQEIHVPFDAIERARLKADFDTAAERDGTHR